MNFCMRVSGDFECKNFVCVLKNMCILCVFYKRAMTLELIKETLGDHGIRRYASSRFQLQHAGTRTFV